jgi:hypothetical protein
MPPSPAVGRKLVCPLCGKSAVSADELLKHARAAHANRHVAEQPSKNKHSTVIKLFK